jgi:hypothetical protein
MGQAGDDGFSGGQRGRTQHRRELRTEAAAADQDQPLGAFRELIGELQPDASAEAVARDRRLWMAERDEEVSQRRGVGAEGVVAGRGVGVAVAGEIRRDHGVRDGEGADEVPPGVAVTAQPVDEQQGFTRAGGRVGDSAAGEFAAVPDQRHGGGCRRAGLSCGDDGDRVLLPRFVPRGLIGDASAGRDTAAIRSSSVSDRTRRPHV